MPKTQTSTKTYTTSRINVIDDHFELFLRCAGMDDDAIKLFLEAVDNHEIDAIGIYIMENEKRVAEVEFNIDWERHLEEIRVYGEIFDTDLPGWEDGVSVEAYVAVSRLSKAAKKRKLHISSWMIVSKDVWLSEEKHKELCERLGYDYYSTPPDWKKEPKENSRCIEGLSEAKIVTRQI